MPSFPKQTIVRSESYRRFVAAHDCFACGVSGCSQCAHANTGKGLAMKACDLQTFPLCAPHWSQIGCHAQFDQSIGMTREERRELEARYVERMQAIARDAGRPEFTERKAA